MKNILKYLWFWFLILSLYLFSIKWELWILSLIIWLLLIPSVLEYIKGFIKNKFKKDYSNKVYYWIIIFLIAWFIWWFSPKNEFKTNTNTFNQESIKNHLNSELIEYFILDENYYSEKNLIRYSLFVVVPWSIIKESDIKNIADQVISEYKNKWANEIYLYFINNEAEGINNWYSLGKATFINWITQYTYSEKLKTGVLNTPSTEEFEIANKISLMLYENNWISEEEVYKILSEELKISAEKIAEIHRKVMFW